MQKACEICELIEGPLSNNASFLAMYAAILRRLNLLSRAESVFKQALSIEPNSKEVKNNYSNLLIDQGKFDQALQLLNEILSDFPDYDDALKNKERCELIMTEISDDLHKKSKMLLKILYRMICLATLSRKHSIRQSRRAGGK